MAIVRGLGPLEDAGNGLIMLPMNSNHLVSHPGWRGAEAAMRLGPWAVAWLFVVLALSTVSAHEQDRQPAAAPNPQTSALINQQLDAPIDLSVVNRRLPDVLEQIKQKSGVPFVVSEETYSLLPYGQDTPINVNGRGTLRQTLELIGSALGLEYVLRSENVEFRPLPALERTGRRATVQDLAGLDLLRQTRLSLEEDRPTVAQVLEAIDLKLQELDVAAGQKNELPPGFQIENRLDETLRQRPVFIGRNATLLSALEAITEQTAATWYPWGDSFIVLPKDQWVRRRLEEPVTLSIPQVDVQEAILELQQVTGVPFAIEPGAVQRVPEQFRRVRLYIPGRSVRSALESLGSLTGLGYIVSDDGVYVYYAADGERGAGPPGAGSVEQPSLLVDLGDGTSLLLYPADLPEELRSRLEGRRRQAIEQLRQKLLEPTTQPTN